MQLDAGELQIDAVTEDGVALTFEKTASQLNIQVPKHLPKHERASTQANLDITYHGKPKGGMQFAPDVGQVITAFSTSQWLPCIKGLADGGLGVHRQVHRTCTGAGRRRLRGGDTAHAVGVDTDSGARFTSRISPRR